MSKPGPFEHAKPVFPALRDTVADDRLAKAASELEFKESSTPEPGLAERQVLCEIAKEVFRARAVREEYFPAQVFGEYAWDILLLLYIETSRAKRISLAALAAQISAPIAVVLRWIAYLETDQIVLVTSDPNDENVKLAELCEASASTMDRCLKAMLPVRTLMPDSSGNVTTGGSADPQPFGIPSAGRAD